MMRRSGARSPYSPIGVAPCTRMMEHAQRVAATNSTWPPPGGRPEGQTNREGGAGSMMKRSLAEKTIKLEVCRKKTPPSFTRQCLPKTKQKKPLWKRKFVSHGARRGCAGINNISSFVFFFSFGFGLILFVARTPPFIPSAPAGSDLAVCRAATGRTPYTSAPQKRAYMNNAPARPFVSIY